MASRVQAKDDLSLVLLLPGSCRDSDQKRPEINSERLSRAGDSPPFRFTTFHK